MIYFAILSYIILLSYVYDFGHHKFGRNFHFLILLIILICLAGFRYRIGVDTIRYEMAFSQVPVLSQLDLHAFQEAKYDPLFLILASTAKTLNPEFWVLQMFQSLLVNIVFFRFFYKNTKYLFLSLLLYFCLIYVGHMTETMRESCAISMFLFGREFYKKGHKIKLLLCCILAYLFHSSAIILFIIFAIIAINLDKYIRFTKGVIIFALCVLVIAPLVQDFFINNISYIAITTRIMDKIEMYSATDMFDQRLNIFGIIVIVLLYVFIPYICIITLRNTKYATKLEFILVLEMFFAVISAPIYIFYRYVGYLMPFVIIALTNSLAENNLTLPLWGKIKTNNIIAWSIILLPFIINTIYVMNHTVRNSNCKNYSKFYPYSSIFSKELDADREALFSYYNL